MRKDIIPMSTKELKKLHLIKKAGEKLMTQAQAADLLDITERQFKRIIQNYRLLGERGLVHQLRDKSSNRNFSDHFKKSIVYIYQKNFLGYKPTFFTEKLASEFNISLSKESVQITLAEHTLWTVRKKRLKHSGVHPITGELFGQS